MQRQSRAKTSFVDFSFKSEAIVSFKKGRYVLYSFLALLGLRFNHGLIASSQLFSSLVCFLCTKIKQFLAFPSILKHFVCMYIYLCVQMHTRTVKFFAALEFFPTLLISLSSVFMKCDSNYTNRGERHDLVVRLGSQCWQQHGLRQSKQKSTLQMYTLRWS